MITPKRPNRPRFTYANVLSTLALFLALGGGSFAVAAALSKNSVKSKQVKDESLLAQDLKNGSAVGTEEVIDGSLGPADLGDGSVGTAEVLDGALGAADLSNGSVGSSEIADGSVGSGDLADGSVGSSKISDGSVGSSAIADGAVGTGDLGNGSVTAAKLAADEAPHVVGAAGQPAFATGGDGDCIWSDKGLTKGDLNPVSFYKDKGGRVFMTGIPASADGAGGDGTCDQSSLAEVTQDFTAFTLPPAYRPAKLEVFTTTDGSNIVLVLVGGAADTTFAPGIPVPAGAVLPIPTVGSAAITNGVVLGGTSWRAG